MQGRRTNFSPASECPAWYTIKLLEILNNYRRALAEIKHDENPLFAKYFGVSDKESDEKVKQNIDDVVIKMGEFGKPDGWNSICCCSIINNKCEVCKDPDDLIYSEGNNTWLRSCNSLINADNDLKMLIYFRELMQITHDFVE